MALIHQLSSKLHTLKDTLHLTDKDFPYFIEEEYAYLRSGNQPPLQDVMKIHYIQVLDELHEKSM